MKGLIIRKQSLLLLRDDKLCGQWFCRWIGWINLAVCMLFAFRMAWFRSTSTHVQPKVQVYAEEHGEGKLLPVWEESEKDVGSIHLPINTSNWNTWETRQGDGGHFSLSLAIFLTHSLSLSLSLTLLLHHRPLHRHHLAAYLPLYHLVSALTA